MTSGPSKYYRTLFISDLHLGSHKCQADRLYNFLKNTHANKIYLVGDVFDSCREMPVLHRQIVGLLFKRMLRGVRVIYIPGNHDHWFRKTTGDYGYLTVSDFGEHEMVDGRLIRVSHGDETDTIRLHFILSLVVKFENLTNTHLWEVLRSKLFGVIDRHTKRFEQKMLKKYPSYAGVACGHIHKPNIIMAPKIYLNPGDWTQHCSAVAEQLDGQFVLLQG